MKDAFKHQTAVNAAELAGLLEALAEGVRAGSLPLSEGERNFSLSPQGLIDLSLKVRRKAGLVKLSLDLAWAEAWAAGEAEANVYEADTLGGAHR